MVCCTVRKNKEISFPSIFALFEGEKKSRKQQLCSANKLVLWSCIYILPTSLQLSVYPEVVDWSGPVSYSSSVLTVSTRQGHVENEIGRS